MRSVVDEVLSPAGRWKVEITGRDDGNFQVHLLRLVEDVSGGQAATSWIPVTTAASVTDSAAAAREIADALLRRHARAEFETLDG